jgi:hypothetical protein
MALFSVIFFLENLSNLENYMNSPFLSGASSEDVESKAFECDNGFNKQESARGNDGVVADWDFDISFYDKRATEKLLMSSQNKSQAFLSNLLNHIGLLVDFYFNINSEDTQYYASITIGITRRKGFLLDLSLKCEL